MSRKKSPPGDDFNIRCPRLGHQIHYAYCRIENNGLPCFKTLDCWYRHFEVEKRLKQELTQEEWDQVFGKGAKPKMVSLLELIEQAKKSTQKKDP